MLFSEGVEFLIRLQQQLLQTGRLSVHTPPPGTSMGRTYHKVQGVSSPSLGCFKTVAPTDQRVFDGVRIVAVPYAGNRKPEPFVQLTRRFVGAPDLEGRADCAKT